MRHTVPQHFPANQALRQDSGAQDLRSHLREDLRLVHTQACVHMGPHCCSTPEGVTSLRGFVIAGKTTLAVDTLPPERSSLSRVPWATPSDNAFISFPKTSTAVTFMLSATPHSGRTSARRKASRQNIRINRALAERIERADVERAQVPGDRPTNVPGSPPGPAGRVHSWDDDVAPPEHCDLVAAPDDVASLRGFVLAGKPTLAIDIMSPERSSLNRVPWAALLKNTFIVSFS